MSRGPQRPCFIHEQQTTIPRRIQHFPGAINTQAELTTDCKRAGLALYRLDDYNCGLDNIGSFIAHARLPALPSHRIQKCIMIDFTFYRLLV